MDEESKRKMSSDKRENDMTARQNRANLERRAKKMIADANEDDRKKK